MPGWIKMRLDLADDPAVIGVASKLSLSEYEVVGRLHKLWSWADRHTEDGHASGVTYAWLNRYVECDGFAEAVESVGWLERLADGVCIPSFDKHNGESAKKRELAANRKRKQREGVTQSPHQESRKERDESVTRGEERREEVKTPYSPPVGDKPAPARLQNQIIDLYHEILPELPSVNPSLWGGVRKKNLEARIKQYPKAADPEWWRKFFQRCSQSDLLMGRLPPKPDQLDPWRADLGWMVKPENFRKIVEGNYLPQSEAA